MPLDWRESTIARVANCSLAKNALPTTSGTIAVSEATNMAASQYINKRHGLDLCPACNVLQNFQGRKPPHAVCQKDLKFRSG